MKKFKPKFKPLEKDSPEYDLLLKLAQEQENDPEDEELVDIQVIPKSETIH